MNCLMIKLKDKRKFITNKKFAKHLIEFANTFDAELSIVSTNHKKLLNLEELADLICDTNHAQEDIKYKTVKVLNNKEENNNNLIFSQIIKTLKQKKTIDTNKLITKYKKKGIDEKNIYSQINKAKNHIKKIGITLKKLSKSQFTAI